MPMLEIAAGRRLAYWEAGTGPALVFVHGVGTSGELWTGDLAELADECRVITYDRRGYGASSASPRDWKAHCDDAIALIEALRAAPAVIVGYSGGAIVALDLVLRRPELASSVVLLDPAFHFRRCLTLGALKTIATAQIVRRLRGPRRGAEHWMRYVASHPDGSSSFDRASPERRERLLENAPAVFADFESGSGEHVDASRLAGIDVPVTLVEAELSPKVLRRCCERLRRHLPQARTITLERSGHHVSVDAREDVLRILREALGARRLSGDAGAA